MKIKLTLIIVLFLFYRMALTSGELLEIPTGLIREGFLCLRSFAGAPGTGLKSFKIVATGT